MSSFAFLNKKVKISNGLTWTYDYDHRNQLIEVQRRTTDGGTLEEDVDFQNDAYGNRLIKIVDENGDGDVDYRQRYGLDGWNSAKPSPQGTENWDVWADLNGGYNLQTRYLRGDVVDQIFARTAANGDAYWYFGDHLGSIRDITDNTGAVKDTLAYDGFGNITAETDPAFRGRYAWTSREYDTEIELQYNRARYYDAKTGRWISQDPLGFEAGDSNLYRYVKNRPTYVFDESGLAPRNLLIPEKALVAIFHNALNKLKQQEFTEIISDTLFGTVGDLQTALANLGLIEQIAEAAAQHLRKKFVQISFGNGAEAITLPPCLAPPSKRVTWVIWKTMPNGFQGNNIKNILDVGLISHELQHAVQIIRAGRGGSEFLNRYLLENGENLLKGMNGRNAYENISFEVESYAFQYAVETVLSNKTLQNSFHNVVGNYKDNIALTLISSNPDGKALAASFLVEYKKEFGILMKKAISMGAPAGRYTIPLYP